MGKIIDLTNKKFGRLTVIDKHGKDRFGNILWNCICECGKIKITKTHHLLKGICKSCGCIHKEGNSRTHKMSGTRIYNIWHGMIERCYNANSASYSNYGGRGITVCSSWKKGFSTFYKWASKNGYANNLTIDRINVNGNYKPNNCRWVNIKEQANNKRTNIVINYNGKNKTLKQWSEDLEMSYSCLRHRLYRGWSEEETLSVPPNLQYNKKTY